MEKDRVRLASVRAPEDDQVRLLSLAVRRGSSSGSEHCRQTGDAWSVSSPVAAVDVVAVHDDPRELLRVVVHLVALFRAAEHAEGIGSLVSRRGKAGRGPLERLIPGSGTQAPVLSDERFGQTDKPVIHENGT